MKAPSRGSGEWLNPVEPASNDLLRALRSDDAAILSCITERWWGEFGQVLFEPGDIVTHVYFPCGPSLISYLVIPDEGRPLEVALIGREGAAGGLVSHGCLPAYAKAEVQYPGPFFRIELAKLEEASLQSLTLRHLFARYADCLVAQVFQAVACNASHSIEQRTAKWLISAMERTGASDIPLTQEQLAEMLGVGRSYMSRVLNSFKKRNLIITRRGRMLVTEVERLRAIACKCNDRVRRHFENVICGVYPEETQASAPVSC